MPLAQRDDGSLGSDKETPASSGKNFGFGREANG